MAHEALPRTLFRPADSAYPARRRHSGRISQETGSEGREAWWALPPGTGPSRDLNPGCFNREAVSAQQCTTVDAENHSDLVLIPREPSARPFCVCYPQFKDPRRDSEWGPLAWAGVEIPYSWIPLCPTGSSVLTLGQRCKVKPNLACPSGERPWRSLGSLGSSLCQWSSNGSDRLGDWKGSGSGQARWERLQRSPGSVCPGCEGKQEGPVWRVFPIPV